MINCYRSGQTNSCKCLGGRADGAKIPVGMWWFHPSRPGCPMPVLCAFTAPPLSTGPPFLSPCRERSKGGDHIEAARQLADRLFSEEHVRLGFREALGNLSSLAQSNESANTNADGSRNEVIEMLNSSGLWERRSGQTKECLSRAWVLQEGEWIAALSLPHTLSKITIGNPCRFGSRKSPTYGKEIPLAVYVEESIGEKVTLIKSFRKLLRQAVLVERPRGKKKYSRKTWNRLGLEDQFRAFFPAISQGGELVEFVDRGKVLNARLSYDNARALAGKIPVAGFCSTPS